MHSFYSARTKPSNLNLPCMMLTASSTKRRRSTVKIPLLPQQWVPNPLTWVGTITLQSTNVWTTTQTLEHWHWLLEWMLYLSPPFHEKPVIISPSVTKGQAQWPPSSPREHTCSRYRFRLGSLSRDLQSNRPNPNLVPHPDDWRACRYPPLA